MPEPTHIQHTIARLHSRTRKAKHSRQEIGSAPGTIVQAPDAKATKMNGWSFHAKEATQAEISDIGQNERMRSAAASGTFLWVDVRGLSNTELIETIGDFFGLHPLVMEDFVNVAQRP